ncbi:hypothetical protein [Candidatus Nitronereus thalassa]|uniref:PRC-barrel domain protein n=1 Tax=Candidatus Nitronereus thalassa TaxID=3020898 RepID=A0ABU3KBD6_9BACT|nr:hypothetical protein [Candidatus Nitronereus thalassa]MDT7043746.1 hypothetical protein [Candidatus Nitronereus thalassa]
MNRVYYQQPAIHYAIAVSLATVIGTTLIGATTSALALSKPLGGHIQGKSYVVRGKLVNVQGDQYWIRKSTGEDIRIKVTADTNMVCESNREMPSKAITTGRTEMKQKPKTKGFRIGDCPPEPGQYVKAETTDIGTASFVRSYDEGSILRQTERLGLPQQYSVFPVVRGELQQVPANDFAVRTEDGKQIGNLKKVIIDTQVGNIVYGVVALDQVALQSHGMELARGSLMAAPWDGFTVSDKGNSILINATFDQLSNMPAFGNEMSVYDVRAFWELHDPTLKSPVTPEYQGVDRVANLDLERERARYESARDRFLDTQTKFEDDRQAMERARERWEDALLDYRTETGKTIQQELQSQIFR